MRIAVAAGVLFVLAATASAQPALTRSPRLVHFVEAEYPAAEKAAGVTATVVLALEIDAAGNVAKATVTGSAGAAFDAAALAAARQFRFQPAEVDGKPAPVIITYRYRFTLAVHQIPVGPQVNFEGTVRDRFAKTPLAGVTVALPDLGLSTKTDAEGRFAFTDLPVGTHEVEVSGPDLVTVSTEEEIAAETRRTVTYWIEPAGAGESDEEVDEEIEIRAARIERDVSDVHIEATQARRVAGTQGDTLKIVHNLPGVARAAVGSGQLVVWGSAPADTHIYVDGVEIPALYHLGGLRSILASELVGGIDFVPGAYGAPWGRGLGGLVAVTTRRLPPSGVHGHVAADLLDSSAALSAAAGQTRVAVAGRQSHIDRLLGGAIDPEIEDVFPVPRYRDAAAKAEIDLRRDETLSVGALAAADQLTRSIRSDDPALTRSDEQEVSFARFYLRYDRLLPAGASAQVTTFAGVDRQSRTARTGERPTDESVRRTVGGARAGYRARLASRLTGSIGLDLIATRSRLARTGSLSLPPREGDITVFGQDPGDELNADRWTVDQIDAAPYAAAELALGRLSLTPGLRLDAYLLSVSSTFPRRGGLPPIGDDRMMPAVEPRIAARLDLGCGAAATAEAGRYHQPPDASDLGPVFGTPSLELSSATHLAAGGELALRTATRFQLVGFGKWLDDLPVRSAELSPLVAHALDQSGEGRTFGVQALVRQDPWHGIGGWIAYSLSRSQRRRGDEPWRLFDFDQTHVLTALASYQLGDWSFGARFRYATGAPRTTVVGSTYDARRDVFQPIFGPHNRIRLPAFAQLDLRVDRRFRFPSFALEIYLELQNVLARENAEELAYSFDYSERDVITGLPPLAVAGARAEF